MSRYCPIADEKVIYQFCEDCEEKLCNSPAGTKTHDETAAGTNPHADKPSKEPSDITAAHTVQ